MLPPRPVVRGSKNPLYFALPQRLRKAREAAGLTKRKLCADAGVSLGTAFRIEDEERVPRVDVVEMLARALRLDPCVLAYGVHGDQVFSQKVPGGAGRPGDLPVCATPAQPAGPLSCEGVPARLAMAREARGLTSKDLGKKSGTTGQTVANIEAGRNVPSVATVEALAVALEVSPCWLAYGQGQGPTDAA